MHSQESVIVFDAVSKENTETTIDAVVSYCSTHSLLEKMNKSTINHLYVFTQYLDSLHHMEDTVREQLERSPLVQGVYEVSQKYLNKVIGQAGVDCLRELSQGIKVCIELAHFAQTKQLLEEEKKFIVIAGRIEGADTAVVFIKKKNMIKMIDLLCFSIDE